MAVVPRKGDTPFQTVAAHGKISQALFDEARHFVHSEMWRNGVGVVCVPLQEAIFET